MGTEVKDSSKNAACKIQHWKELIIDINQESLPNVLKEPSEHLLGLYSICN